jgi:hypothetical protein
MKQLFIFAILLLCSFSTISADFKPYQWEQKRSRYKLSPKELAMPELVLKSHTQIEYVHENDDFLMYSTVHRIFIVNNNEAVQKHNRIFIPMYNTIELVDLKARSISKDGKEILFDKSNLKEVKDEETGNAYRIFAIEGIELGSEIEYFYVRKMQSDIFQRIPMQGEIPIKNSTFYVSCPKHLKFAFKSYFGYPEVKEETKEEVNIYTASMDNVPALKREKFSYYDANIQRIEFKLAYNTARSQARMYTWDDAGKRFFEILTTLSKDDAKAVDKFMKEIADNPKATAVDRIKNVEQKIKTTIQVSEEAVDRSLSEISSITRSRLASNDGITKLFLAVFDRLKIDCHPVVTCSREKVKFDGSFDTWGYLDDYLLFFPATNGFIAPYAAETRHPLVPARFTAQSGLFIEPFVVGELKSALATIKEIPASDYLLNTDNLDIEVKFADDFSTSQIRSKREFGGYNSTFIIPYYPLMNEEQRKTMVEEMTKETAPDAAIAKWEAKPANEKFVMDVDYASNHFLEKAGPRLLFKIGLLIGPQVEMYREEQRTTQIENFYNRGYDRVIRVNIPDGYTIKNPNDLKFNIVVKDGEKTPFLFVSDYKLAGSILEVRINEYYKDIYADVKRYDEFRGVVNAAADFNKVTLVLEKKK